MKYAQHGLNCHSRKRQIPWKIIGGIFVALIIILVFIRLFSGNDVEVVEVIDGSHTDGLVENQDLSVEIIPAAVSMNDSLLNYDEIELIEVDGSGSSGIARRGNSNEVFTHVIVASLPIIDLEYYFYEGWLVKPGIVDFFSTGEMFLREDGKWGLVWEIDDMNAPVDLFDFSQIVVTFEPRDGDSAPAAHHILEGEF